MNHTQKEQQLDKAADSALLKIFSPGWSILVHWSIQEDYYVWWVKVFVQKKNAKLAVLYNFLGLLSISLCSRDTQGIEDQNIMWLLDKNWVQRSGAVRGLGSFWQPFCTAVSDGLNKSYKTRWFCWYFTFFSYKYTNALNPTAYRCAGGSGMERVENTCVQYQLYAKRPWTWSIHEQHQPYIPLPPYHEPSDHYSCSLLLFMFV